jgi:hypothetical protein
MSYGLIYEPRGAAREYAQLACNVYHGCEHGCRYCFGPNVLRQEKTTFHEQAGERPNFLVQLKKDAARLRDQGVKGQVHLCFTTDPYQPMDVKLGITRSTIEVLHANGFSVAILTKGGSRSLKDIDLFGPTDAMAATITYARDEDSLREEPNAALPQDRLDALKIFHNAHVPTWISCEPVLDPKQTLYCIELMHYWVDHVKVGKLNHDPKREATIDWYKFAKNAVKLLERLGYKRILDPDDAVRATNDNRTFYVKSGLVKFLEA